jgi:hypothetical protein
VDRGAALYAEHDYVGAAEVFERNEKQFAAASERQRARYALYRGITLQSLGDAQRANYWLRIAADIAQRDSAALDSSEQLTLTQAFASNAVWAARLARGATDGTGKSAEATAAR